MVESINSRQSREGEHTTEPKELTHKELVNRAGKVSLLFAERVTPVLNAKLRNLGTVQVITSSQEGRPEEELIDLDQPGETILKSVIREVPLTVVLMSESTPEPLELNKGATKRVFDYEDPLDNSSPQKRGLDVLPYSVQGLFDECGNSLSSSIVDPIKRIAYMNIGKENFLYDLETKERRPLHKSERTTLKDKNSTLASFLGEKEYSEKFFKYFGDMVHASDRERKAYLYAGGGAFIYGLLASGAVDAYVMFDEPLSEIIPGLALALAAGCTVVSVNPENGTYKNFKFDPNQLRENHKLYAEGTVPLFMAAATPEIRDELIKAYMDKKNEIAAEAERQKKLGEQQEESSKELAELRKFKNSRPVRLYEIFNASGQPQNSSSN